MFFAEDDDDGPLDEMPSIDEIAAEFPVPLLTLVPQPSIRETVVNTTSSSFDGGPLRYGTASIMYAVFWNPDDLDDPMNHVVLDPESEAALANPSPRLSTRMVEWMRWMRFPLAYEAVQTHVPGDVDTTLAERLALHMSNVIANSFREERYPLVHEPDSFVRPPSPDQAVDASVIVDGVALPGITIDDEHAIGLGVELPDAIATVVFPKHLLPLVRLELVRRPRPGDVSA